LYNLYYTALYSEPFLTHLGSFAVAQLAEFMHDSSMT